MGTLWLKTPEGHPKYGLSGDKSLKPTTIQQQYSIDYSRFNQDPPQQAIIVEQQQIQTPPQVIYREVIKEVPVDRVVEKEIIKEVPVEVIKYVEIEKQVDRPIEVIKKVLETKVVKSVPKWVWYAMAAKLLIIAHLLYKLMEKL